MKIKVEPFLMKKGNRVAKAAIAFDSGVLAGFHLVGFTITHDKERGLEVMFPSSIVRREENGSTKPFWFLRPDKMEDLDRLEDEILDVYTSMVGKGFNNPKLAE